jgi:hypothetical protein
MGEHAHSELSRHLRGDGAPLGALFSFMSGLYFRGKLAYARAFANAPPEVSGSFVITACGGLVPSETLVTLDRLRAISAIDIDPNDARYPTCARFTIALTADRNWLRDRSFG